MVGATTVRQSRPKLHQLLQLETPDLLAGVVALTMRHAPAGRDALRADRLCQTEKLRMEMAEFPDFNAPNAVSSSDRADAIELVNRVNWLFDTWDVDRIMDLFLPDAVIRHPHGVASGQAEQRSFITAYYPLVPGVSRHATNHIVDADGDDLVVRYHNLLVRYAMPDDAESVRVATEIVGNDDGLPAIWIASPMVDRIRRTEEGWKIAQRLVGGAVRNDRLTPQQ